MDLGYKRISGVFGGIGAYCGRSFYLELGFRVGSKFCMFVRLV